MRVERNLPDVEHLPEVRGMIVGDESGRLLEGTVDPAEGIRWASQTAAAIRELEAVAAASGIGALDTCIVKASRRTAVVAVRAGMFVQIAVDPAKGTQQVERALGEWMSDTMVLTSSELQVVARDGVADAMDSTGSDIRAPRPAAGGPVEEDAWATLRRLLVRGQLTDAAAMRSALRQPEEPGTPPPASAEPVDAGHHERKLDALLEGVGSVLSGDALGGLRTLRRVASGAERSRTFRWLALHWGTLAAVQCSNLPIARALVRDAVPLSRQLDAGSQAVSSWDVAEVLLAESSCERALDWAARARVLFERAGDTWGLGRACLAEARVLAAIGRDEEANEAARRAAAHDAAWDDPPVFLAHRSLERGAVDEAEAWIRAVTTAAAERIRQIARALRVGVLTPADAGALLRHLHAAPSVESARALARVAHVAPRLPVAREALAWMLLKAGRYAEAERHFTALAASSLAPAIRSSVMLGLGCVAHAQRTGRRPEASLQAAVRAAVEQPPEASDPGATPAPASSTATAFPGAAGAVFSGKLSLFAVPDLLEFLRGARRTGLLLCSCGAGTSALHFREGRITAATAPSTPGVGELLIRSRKLSPVVLEAVLQRQKSPSRTDGALGDVLVRAGVVSIEDVKEALRVQVGLVIKSIVGWRDGEFVFNHDEGKGEAEIGVEVDPQEVLLNVLREMDEAARSRALT